MDTARIFSATLILALAGAGSARAATPGAARGAPPLAAAAAPAQQRSWRLVAFHAELLVDREGVLHVDEHLRARFDGSYQGIYRDIPVRYRRPSGGAYRLRIGALRATDAEGRRLRLEKRISGGNLRIKVWVPGAQDATREVVLHYEVANGLRFFQDHDELYWNVTGSDWAVPIDQASATVYLPPTAGGIRTEAYTGPQGSTASDADVAVVGNGVAFRTRGALRPGEGLTLVVGWDPGVVARPGALARVGGAVALYWPLALPLLAFLGMLGLWRRFGDDPDTGPVVVRYQPPRDLSPAEVGYMDHETTDVRGVTATIVDLAVRGYLTIEEVEKPRFLGLGEKTDYVFVRRDDGPPRGSLRPHEREVLDGLFRLGRDRTEMSDLKGEFYKAAKAAREDVEERILDAKLYGHSPTKVRVGFGLAGGLAGFGIAGLGQKLALTFAAAPVVWIVAGIGVALTVAVWGWFMPARTMAGAALRAQTEGFREFLSRVDADRYNRMMLKPEMFDRYLPFAIALGVEERWAKRFEGMTLPPPEWYHGATPVTRFSPGGFVHSLSGVTAAAAAAATPPSSSGSSGLGGGGFSGGGFGGGGGGAF